MFTQQNPISTAYLLLTFKYELQVSFEMEAGRDCDYM